MGPATLQLSRRSGPETAWFPFNARSTDQDPLLTHRLGLTLDIGEEGRVVFSLQPLLDEGAKDDLKTDRELERGRRLPRKDPSPVDDISGEDEEDSGFLFEHRDLRFPQARPAAGRSPAPGVPRLIFLILLI